MLEKTLWYRVGQVQAQQAKQLADKLCTLADSTLEDSVKRQAFKIMLRNLIEVGESERSSMLSLHFEAFVRGELTSIFPPEVEAEKRAKCNT